MHCSFDLTIYQLILGIGSALAFTPLRFDFELSTNEVEKEMTEKSPNNCVLDISAQGYGLYNSCFSLGMLVGPLWADFGVTHFGWRGMTCSLGVLSFFAANLVVSSFVKNISGLDYRIFNEADTCFILVLQYGTTKKRRIRRYSHLVSS